MSSQERSGSPQYKNQAGTLLFRHHWSGRAEYWYLSRPGNLDSSDGDYFRAWSTASTPPIEGWARCDSCPLGQRPGSPSLKWAEEEAQKDAEEEEIQRAEEEARWRAEEEARRKAEKEARRKAQEEAKRKAEEKARRKAEEEAKKKAEEKARRKAEEEAKKKAEEEAFGNEKAAIEVSGSGAPKVNGKYFELEEHQQDEAGVEGAPQYKNLAGTLLFKYSTSSWYFSRPGNLDSSDGDYFQVDSSASRPPTEGWSLCPLGRRPAPSLKWADEEA